MSDEPGWFTTAVATPFESRSVIADGCRIAYRTWGRPGDPLVVLVHGGAANAAWWDHIAPYLAANQRVVALDLAGHGDSDWQPAYTLDSWATQVMAVADAEGPQPPVLFGHSLGGFVTLTAARLFGAAIQGAVTIDSPVRARSTEEEAWRAERHSELRPFPVRRTREEILARFRTLPEDDSTQRYIRDYIAERSVRSVADGWTWKFDPRIFHSTAFEPDDLGGVTCRVALVRSERGMATEGITADVVERLGNAIPVTIIPDAGHHILLDQPIALIAVLQTLSQLWLGGPTSADFIGSGT